MLSLAGQKGGSPISHASPRDLPEVVATPVPLAPEREEQGWTPGVLLRIDVGPGVGLSRGEVKHQDRCEPSTSVLPSHATAEGVKRPHRCRLDGYNYIGQSVSLSFLLLFLAQLFQLARLVVPITLYKTRCLPFLISQSPYTLRKNQHQMPL